MCEACDTRTEERNAALRSGLPEYLQGVWRGAVLAVTAKRGGGSSAFMVNLALRTQESTALPVYSNLPVQDSSIAVLESPNALLELALEGKQCVVFIHDPDPWFHRARNTQGLWLLNTVLSLNRKIGMTLFWERKTGMGDYRWSPSGVLKRHTGWGLFLKKTGQWTVACRGYEVGGDRAVQFPNLDLSTVWDRFDTYMKIDTAGLEAGSTGSRT